MDRELQIAVEAARAAGAIHLSELGSELDIGTKSSATDLVTRVDRACEEAVRAVLGRAFPADGILGEEEGRTGASARREWVVDPLDGTLNYAHGFPYFAVSIALRSRDEGLLVGVVYDAWKDELFAAVRGGGATRNGVPLRTSTRARLAESMLATGFAYEGRLMKENLALFGEMLGRTRALRRPGAAALDLAYVAAGRLDGFWELYLKPWDTAAGALLVMEAGGVVTNGAGAPYTPGDRSVVAAGPALHAELSAALREAGIEAAGG